MTLVKPLRAKDRLMVALDVPTAEQAEELIKQLGDSVGVYKIGMQLGFAGGLELARRLANEGQPVFIDLKLLDIANTVAGGIASLVALGAAFATVHAYPQAMRAAVEARGESSLNILGVTVLTSLGKEDLSEAGYRMTPERLVVRRAKQAVECGADGVVASPMEAAAIRRMTGRDFLIVTPGIRPSGDGEDDQKRVSTPAAAISAGADYLVVGRPVIRASDPRRAALSIVEEIEQAL